MATDSVLSPPAARRADKLWEDVIATLAIDSLLCADQRPHILKQLPGSGAVGQRQASIGESRSHGIGDKGPENRTPQTVFTARSDHAPGAAANVSARVNARRP